MSLLIQRGRGCGQGRQHGHGQSGRERDNHDNSTSEEISHYSSQDCGRGVTRGRGAYPRRNKRRYDKSRIEYFNRHKFGHYASECHYDTSNIEAKGNFPDREESEEPILTLTLKER